MFSPTGTDLGGLKPASTVAAVAVVGLCWVALLTPRAIGAPPPPRVDATLGVDGPSFIAPLASESLLLAVRRAGLRLVVVGERGHILLSDDDGTSWRQVLTPTRTTLTAVCFADPRNGWAVGHLGVILRTIDGGETWVRLDAGLDRESVLLDVLFLNATEGYAVGAYGLALHTRDGGLTWEKTKPLEEQFHLNRIVRDDNGALYLAGESGTLLRSHDSGGTWQSTPPPYEGSLFGVLPLPDGAFLTYGLRGRVFRAAGGSANWQPVDSSITTLIMSALRLRNGLIVLAGQSGNMAVSGDDGRSFTGWKPGGSTGVADLIETTDGKVLLVGEKGVRRVDPPKVSP